MNAKKLKAAPLLPLLAGLLVAFSAANVRADLSAKQARKAITQAAGFKLEDSSVRVKSVSTTSKSAAEASAEVKTAFKFEQDKQGIWRVAEVRSAKDTWEDINLIANALAAKIPSGACTALDPPARGRGAPDPSPKRARCLLASLLGVELPSDAIRIHEVAPVR